MDSLLTFGLQLMKVATLFPLKSQSFYIDINKVIAFDADDESIANSIIRLVWAATVDRMGTFVWIEINNATDKYNLDELKWLLRFFFHRVKPFRFEKWFKCLSSWIKLCAFAQFIWIRQTCLDSTTWTERCTTTLNHSQLLSQHKQKAAAAAIREFF